jgi:hypothetical protein
LGAVILHFGCQPPLNSEEEGQSMEACALLVFRLAGSVSTSSLEVRNCLFYFWTISNVFRIREGVATV